MRFEKTAKYEELKGKRGTREFEEWFLRYVPYENAGARARAGSGSGSSAKKTRKNRNTQK